MGLLEGKICVITGSNRGIGLATLNRYAEEGAIVYAVARQEGALEATISELSCKYNAQIVPCYFDVRDDGQILHLFKQVRNNEGKLDVLVNNAAIMKDAILDRTTRESLEETFDVNVYAPIRFIQMAYKLMKRNNKGSIINIVSVVGMEGNAGQVAYSASKGAMISVTKTLAKELAPNGIRVNAIAPGIIDTELHKNVSKDKMMERIERIHLGRIGKPSEIADGCVYLGSDLSSYVTGQIIRIDGQALL